MKAVKAIGKWFGDMFDKITNFDFAKFARGIMPDFLADMIFGKGESKIEISAETKKAETGAKVAKARAEAVIMEKKATGEIDWDITQAKASEGSWKDEWLTVVFTLPLILLLFGEDIFLNLVKKL